MASLLSLDTSSTRTGWAFFIGGKYKKSGVIDLTSKEAKKMSSDDRISTMCKTIFSIIQKLKPDSVVIEKLTVSRNMTTVRVLSKIIGTVYSYSILNDINCIEVEASQWRSALGMQKRGRKRDEYKKISVQYVEELISKKVTDDEADAVCIGLGYMKIKNQSEVKNDYIF